MIFWGVPKEIFSKSARALMMFSNQIKLVCLPKSFQKYVEIKEIISTT